MSRTPMMSREAPFLRLQAALALMIAGLPSCPVLAAPLLRCEIHQGGQVLTRDFAPVSDPYQVESIDINERFRFKAVMVADGAKVQYVKLYTYYQSPRQSQLLHLASYSSPVSQENPEPDALTGRHYLYAPGLGYEMQYGCALMELRK